MFRDKPTMNTSYLYKYCPWSILFLCAVKFCCCPKTFRNTSMSHTASLCDMLLHPYRQWWQKHLQRLTAVIVILIAQRAAVKHVAMSILGLRMTVSCVIHHSPAQSRSKALCSVILCHFIWWSHTLFHYTVLTLLGSTRLDPAHVEEVLWSNGKRHAWYQKQVESRQVVLDLCNGKAPL